MGEWFRFGTSHGDLDFRFEELKPPSPKVGLLRDNFDFRFKDLTSLPWIETSHGGQCGDHAVHRKVTVSFNIWRTLGSVHTEFLAIVVIAKNGYSTHFCIDIAKSSAWTEPNLSVEPLVALFLYDVICSELQNQSGSPSLYASSPVRVG